MCVCNNSLDDLPTHTETRDHDAEAFQEIIIPQIEKFAGLGRLQWENASEEQLPTVTWDDIEATQDEKLAALSEFKAKPRCAAELVLDEGTQTANKIVKLCNQALQKWRQEPEHKRSIPLIPPTKTGEFETLEQDFARHLLAKLRCTIPETTWQAAFDRNQGTPLQILAQIIIEIEIALLPGDSSTAQQLDPIVRQGPQWHKANSGNDVEKIAREYKAMASELHARAGCPAPILAIEIIKQWSDVKKRIPKFVSEFIDRQPIEETRMTNSRSKAEMFKIMETIITYTSNLPFSEQDDKTNRSRDANTNKKNEACMLFLANSCKRNYKYPYLHPESIARIFGQKDESPRKQNSNAKAKAVSRTITTIVEIKDSVQIIAPTGCRANTRTPTNATTRRVRRSTDQKQKV